jgi:hypothetical protein
MEEVKEHMKVTSLRAYLYNINMKTKEFAEILGCTRQHLTEVMAGTRYPSLLLSREIWRATGGVIKIPCRPRNKKRSRKVMKKEIDDWNSSAEITSIPESLKCLAKEMEAGCPTI